MLCWTSMPSTWTLVPWRSAQVRTLLHLSSNSLWLVLWCICSWGSHLCAKCQGVSLLAGTMITAPLGRSYLLTADHCFVGGPSTPAGPPILSLAKPARCHTLTDSVVLADKDRIGNFDYWYVDMLPLQCSPLRLPPLPKECEQDLCIRRVLIMNYEQPCNSKEVPALKQVMQVCTWPGMQQHATWHWCVSTSGCIGESKKACSLRCRA